MPLNMDRCTRRDPSARLRTVQTRTIGNFLDGIDRRHTGLPPTYLFAIRQTSWPSHSAGMPLAVQHSGELVCDRSSSIRVVAKVVLSV